MRDLQLLFEPYNEDQIIEILEKKTNLKYHALPTIMRYKKEIKDVFFDLLEEKASKFIALKVSRMNGDLRVAFDLVKSCFA
jgi:Cdc6-like AAA superfamily ATPase